MWISAYFFEKPLYKPHKTIYNALINKEKPHKNIINQKQNHKSYKQTGVYNNENSRIQICKRLYQNGR